MSVPHDAAPNSPAEPPPATAQTPAATAQTQPAAAQTPAATAQTQPAAPAPSGHRTLVAVLLTLATVLAFFACFAVWVNRQVLDTAQWTDTSSRLLEDPRVQTAVGAYLVSEVFRAVDVTQRIERALPGQLDGLAGPLATGTRELADRAVPQLLAAPATQAVWRQANRVAHEQLIRILNGGGKVVSTSKGVVALNVRTLITELAAQLGLSSQLEAAREKLGEGAGAGARAAAEARLGVQIPKGSGQIVIMRSDQLRTAQAIVRAVRGLALLLPLLAVGLFAAAIALARGRRRETLRTSGWCLAGVGIALLIGRRVGGNEIVGGLVANPANKPAAEAVWSIGTSVLHDIAIAMVVYGLVLVAAAWLAGATRPASFTRSVAAPWLREHRLAPYGMTAGVLLLLVLWGPTPALRQLWPVVGFAAVAALGVTALRRQTALEFPTAQRGEALTRLRTASARLRHRGEAQGAHAARSPGPADAGRGDAGPGDAGPGDAGPGERAPQPPDPQAQGGHQTRSQRSPAAAQPHDGAPSVATRDEQSVRR